MTTDTLVSTYCGNYPERDHRDCPSSVECQQVTLADLLAEPPVIGELPIGELLMGNTPNFCSPRRASHKADHIQAFVVGPGNAECAAQILAAAGYHVMHADNYVVHIVR